MKTKKRMVIILCAVLALVIVLGAALLPGIFRRASYDASVFGKKFVIQSCVYEGYYTYYEPAHTYYLSPDGCLYQSTSEEAVGKISDAMTSLELTEENFDKHFPGELWTVEDMDARYVREHTEKAWYAAGNNGKLYCVLLQDNGDVLLCIGRSNQDSSGNLNIAEIGDMLLLRNAGAWKP